MYKNNIKIDGITTGHVQGIATDAERKYMYYSFTTCLIKTDMDGNILGSVKGLAGHLGCIAYNYDDGRVYGSLEYKHDGIGTGILNSLQREVEVTDGFYVVAFDTDRIDRMGMDAEKDSIMTAVYLEEVLKDYKANGHRYGCSGIDGLTFAPLPGDDSSKKYLYVAYGIYGDTERNDNDYQIILRYDTENWKAFEGPLNQSSMHRMGPQKPESKYFVYTGNTTYGIQNLEYDAASGCMFAAVYRGRKEGFPNYPMYVIDMKKPASAGKLKNLDETAEILHLAELGQKHEETGIRGINFPYGATGIIALGGGYFYFSCDFSEGKSWGTRIRLYRFDGKSGFEEIDEIWYHGSNLIISELKENSTVTWWKELAEAFSHKPSQLEYDDNGCITHNGKEKGYLYIVNEPVITNEDIYPHPRTSMDDNVEFLTKRVLKLRLLYEL